MKDGLRESVLLEFRYLRVLQLKTVIAFGRHKFHAVFAQMKPSAAVVDYIVRAELLMRVGNKERSAPASFECRIEFVFRLCEIDVVLEVCGCQIVKRLSVVWIRFQNSFEARDRFIVLLTTNQIQSG